jgi:hypothetical protein
MAISEEARYALHRALEQVLGAEHAATMMASIPPVGWGDVATRRDLDVLQARLTGEMHRVVADWGRTVIYANLGALMAMAGLAYAAARL